MIIKKKTKHEVYSQCCRLSDKGDM